MLSKSNLPTQTNPQFFAPGWRCTSNLPNPRADTQEWLERLTPRLCRLPGLPSVASLCDRDRHPSTPMRLRECIGDALSAAGQHRLEHLLDEASLARFGTKKWAARALLESKSDTPRRTASAVPDVCETSTTLDAVVGFAKPAKPVQYLESVWNGETATQLNAVFAVSGADARAKLNVQELHDKLLVVVEAQQEAAAEEALLGPPPSPPPRRVRASIEAQQRAAAAQEEVLRALGSASQQRRLAEGRSLSRALKEQETAAEAAAQARAEKEAAVEAAAQAKAELERAQAAATSESQRAWLLFEVEEVRREEARRRRPIPEGVPPPLVVPVKRTSRALRMRTKLKANPPQQVQRLWVLRQERRVAWS